MLANRIKENEISLKDLESLKLEIKKDIETTKIENFKVKLTLISKTLR